MIKWEVSAEVGCGRSLKPTKRILDLVNKKLKSEHGLAFFYLVGSKTMQEINLRVRGKNEPTNILSLPAENFPIGKQKSLGEIFLCPVEAKRRKNVPAHLIIHGILHLLGYTHENSRDTMEMESKEDEILAYVAHNYRT
jgi:probable rRNA maturation factor